ncbi:GNAT family N-acetyltransferase [bacterium]|nr:GNAT family N-acetyltransferase [bacterium]
MIERVSSQDIKSLEQIISLELDLFQEGGLNIWALQPMAQYQMVYQYLKPKFCAYAILLQDQNCRERVYLFSYGVSVKEQNKGIGKSFLRELIHELRRLGYNELELTVSKDNLAAIYIYQEAMNLLSNSHIKNCYGNGEDRDKLRFSLS